MRATALFFLVNQNPLHKIKINTTIHQLPTLSRPKQRLQRFIYAQLSGNLFAYSGAVKSDWEKRSSSNFLSRLFLARKKIKVLRNGIFLDRLPDIKFHNSPVGAASTHGRLIYLGRNTAWKGVGTFLEIAAVPRLLDFKLLFMIPDMHDLQIDSLDKSLQERITVIAGKSIAYYEPTAGDVHLYPANYGHQAEFVESISLNCLELACLGISSFVSAEGLGTWPDLVDSGIFIETDWIDKVALAELIVVKSKIVRTGDEINFLRSKIDIKNQLTELINSPS